MGIDIYAEWDNMTPREQAERRFVVARRKLGVCACRRQHVDPLLSLESARPASATLGISGAPEKCRIDEVSRPARSRCVRSRSATSALFAYWGSPGRSRLTPCVTQPRRGSCRLAYPYGKRLGSLACRRPWSSRPMDIITPRTCALRQKHWEAAKLQLKEIRCPIIFRYSFRYS